MIGEVFGNYRITAKLGEGGMGAVYLAEHPSIGRKVAVKMIRPAFSNDAETLRRFVREARSTATLRHPALVDIMDYGVHEKTGSAYIVMEYLEGESLDALLERQGPLPPRRAVDVARQIALGMAAAHRAGIIHRDLKPGNVHLIADPDRPGVDVVKVLDFGIAKLANNDTGTGPATRSDVLLGTPRYMAPEQCRGGGVFDHRVDIYSLGCLLYETLSGRPPFVYQWPGELIAAHLGEVPPPLRAFAPAVPEALEFVVMRAIAKHPDHRQPTMAHVAKELEPFLGLEVSVPPVAVGPSVAPRVAGGIVSAGGAVVVPAGDAFDISPALSPASPARPAVVAPQPVALGPAASTTASVVMRQRTGPPLLRRTLISAGAIAIGVGVVAAIVIVQSSSKDTITAAKSEVLAPSPGKPAKSEALARTAASTEDRTAATIEAPPPLATGESLADVPRAAAEAPTDHPHETPEDPASATTAQNAARPASPNETAEGGVRIRVANPRPGLRVMVDGRATSLPVRLPRDQKSHVLAFTAPNFKIETKTVVADQDHTLTLEYRPKLYVP